MVPQCQVICNVANSRLSNPFNCHKYFKCVHHQKEGMVVRPYRCPEKMPVFNSAMGMCVSDVSCINPCEMPMSTSPQTLVFPTTTSPNPAIILPEELITSKPSVNSSVILPVQILPAVLPTKSSLVTTKPATQHIDNSFVQTQTLPDVIPQETSITSNSHVKPTNLVPLQTLPAIVTTVTSLVTTKPIFNKTD
ncbi:unnamed protein product, partial [Meganyctiphanes norvegica]